MFDKVLLPVEGAAAVEGRLRYVSRQTAGRYGAMWEGRVEATTVMEPYSSRPFPPDEFERTYRWMRSWDLIPEGASYAQLVEHRDGAAG